MLRSFLQASGNISQNFPSWMPKTVHLNGICKGHENGRCLKVGHVYLCVDHELRHLASYMKIIQVWISHFQTSVVVLVIILFAHMQKHAKSGCRQQELIQHGCASRGGGQDFLHHQVSNCSIKQQQRCGTYNRRMHLHGNLPHSRYGMEIMQHLKKKIQRCKEREGGREKGRE